MVRVDPIYFVFLISKIQKIIDITAAQKKHIYGSNVGIERVRDKSISSKKEKHNDMKNIDNFKYLYFLLLVSINKHSYLDYLLIKYNSLEFPHLHKSVF